MHKSTEFSVWLDKPENNEMLKNERVWKYCTGGVQCERASALLKQKWKLMKIMYQLQGGIDKYFKDF